MVRLGLGQPGQKLAFHRSIERAINLVKKVERLEPSWLTRRRSIDGTETGRPRSAMKSGIERRAARMGLKRARFSCEGAEIATFRERKSHFV